MEYFPFFLKLSTLKVLIIGGGNIALNKAELLLKSKCFITVIALSISEELQQLLLNSKQHFYQRPFTESDIQNSDIVICATDNEKINEKVWRLAKDHNKWVNVVDDMKKCDFLFPAIVNRDKLTIAIGTEGTAPTVASWIRSQLEQKFSNKWSAFMRLLAECKPQIRQKLSDTKQRRRFYSHLIDTIDITHFDKHLTNQKSIDEKLQSFKTTDKIAHVGKVYLVGAGPGDPELMPVKTQQILQKADVILYDRLIERDILEYARRDALKIFVGKSANNHSKTQNQINDYLHQYAKLGNIVVRLKGGDPLIFARGGEELKFLQQHNIDVEIFPGVSAINGIAANLGIPLTMRGVSDKLLLTSVYNDQNTSVDWQQLVHPKQTVVFYMGLRNIANICQQLIIHSLDPKTPIALVEKGTWQNQKSIFSTIESIALGQKITLQSPVLSIIGWVVDYRKNKHFY